MKFKGISAITAGPALGHDCVIDQVTLEQVCQLGNDSSPVKVFPDHDESVSDLIGAMTNFRIEGEQVKCDLELISEHPMANYYGKILSIFPEALGFSIAWIGSVIEEAGQQVARLVELTSVDLVSQPAANPSGLYSNGEKIARKLKSGAKKSQKVEPASAPAIEMKPDNSIPADSLPVDNRKSTIMANPSLDPTKTTSDIVSEEALAVDPITAALAPLSAAIAALSDKIDAFIANDPVQDAEEIAENMGSGMPSNDQKNKATGLDDGSDESEMSAKLSAVMTKLSILEAANVGSTPVETPREEITGENIIAKYEAITSPVEKTAFAKLHDRVLRTAMAARK